MLTQPATGSHSIALRFGCSVLSVLLSYAVASGADMVFIRGTWLRYDGMFACN